MATVEDRTWLRHLSFVRCENRPSATTTRASQDTWTSIVVICAVAKPCSPAGCCCWLPLPHRSRHRCFHSVGRSVWFHNQVSPTPWFRWPSWIHCLKITSVTLLRLRCRRPFFCFLHHRLSVSVVVGIARLYTTNDERFLGDMKLCNSFRMEMNIFFIVYYTRLQSYIFSR